MIELTGYSSTYQVFDLTLDTVGTVIMQQNGQNQIINQSDAVKLSLTHGDPENVELVLIGKMSKVEISVNFHAVNDLLIRA